MPTDCTEECRARVECVECIVCHRTKAPRGRSVAPEMANGMCDWECPGYDVEPRAPHLWPNEPLSEIPEET